MQTILLHGLGQTASSWENTAKKLAWECLCPNLPAMLEGDNATYRALYSAFKAYCGRFDEPINICGLSLGAVLALQYGIEHPQKVRSLALIAPQFKMPKELLSIQNMIFRFMPNSAFRDTGFSKNNFISLCRSMADIDFTQQLGCMRCNTLILCGANDKANKLAAYKLQRLLPNARLAIIADAGHEVNIDEPEKLANRLNKFWNLTTGS